jgi:glucose-6-phosphate dehydrogenase assembly protein OpcA
VGEYRASLASINRVLIKYVPHGNAPGMVAPKALILAGWLASRLGWRVAAEQSLTQTAERASRVAMEKDGGHLELEFAPVERRAEMQGWIVSIELSAERASPGSFVVLRSEDGRYLETEVSGDGAARSSRTLVGGDKSEAELLALELQIICHDRIYEDAISAAAELLKSK